MEINELACESCQKMTCTTYILECGHIKCENCLWGCESEVAKPTGVSCNVCSHQNVKLDTGVHGKNFLHERLNCLAEVKDNFNTEHSNAKCNLCITDDRHRPEYYCFDKNRYFCKQHFENHNEYKDCVFLNRNEVLEGRFQLLQERRNAIEPMCYEHPRCQAEYMCCGSFICHRCKESHFGHDLLVARHAIDQTRDVLEEEKKSMEKRRNEVKAEAQCLQNKYDLCKKTYREEADGLKDQFNVQIQELITERDRKLETIKREFEAKLVKLDNAIERNEDTLHRIYRFENLTSLSLQILPHNEQFSNTCIIRKMLQTVNNTNSPNTIDSTGATNSLGASEKDHKKSSSTTNPDTLIISCPKHTNALSDVTTDRENNIYAADPTSKSILVFSPTGEFRTELATPCASIQNLCYFSEKLIFSTSDENKVYELSLSNGAVKEVSEYFLFIKGKPFIKPQGMAASLDGKVLYVCDESDKQIHILNERLRKVKSIGGIQDPIAIAVAPNYSIYVLCKGNTVWVIDNKSNRNCISMEDVTAQSGYIATNRQSQILISNTKQNSIHVYSPVGRRERSFAGCSGVGRIISPVGIAVDGKERLIVAELNSRQIKVFSDSVFLQSH